MRLHRQLIFKFHKYNFIRISYKIYIRLLQILDAFNSCFRHIDDLMLAMLMKESYRTNAIALLHDFKSIIDVRKRLPVSDELIDFESAVEIILDKGW